MAKMMKKSTMKKYETGGQKNPNSGKFETAMGVVTRKPGSKGSGGANKGSEMSNEIVKNTKSRATSSGGVNRGKVPTGAIPASKMGGATKMKMKSKSKKK
jgi:hypothetical protein